MLSPLTLSDTIENTMNMIDDDDEKVSKDLNKPVFLSIREFWLNCICPLSTSRLALYNTVPALESEPRYGSHSQQLS